MNISTYIAFLKEFPFLGVFCKSSIEINYKLNFVKLFAIFRLYKTLLLLFNRVSNEEVENRREG
jgi:hypothetical protein